MPPDSTSPRRFYVYQLSRPDGRVFYVGKSYDPARRLQDHESQARRGHSCQRCHVIRKVWAQSGTIGLTLVFADVSESATFAEEQRVIASYPAGTLANRTAGGEGFVGGRHTPESKERIASAFRGQKLSEERRAMLLAGLKTRTYAPLSEEHRRKMSASLSGQTKVFHDPETRSRHLSEAHRGVPLSAEHKKRIGEGSRGRIVSDETRHRISESKKRGYERRRATGG